MTPWWLHSTDPAFVSNASHAQAIVSDDATALDAVTRLFEDRGFLLYAAEAAAEAAAAYGRAGLLARAAASAGRSRALTDGCEDAVTPVLASPRLPASLTPRQRDVAQLASRGLSNREIAHRLSVSVRTIEGHLYQAFAKLGVTERSQLASVLRSPTK